MDREPPDHLTVLFGSLASVTCAPCLGRLASDADHPIAGLSNPLVAGFESVRLPDLIDGRVDNLAVPQLISDLLSERVDTFSLSGCDTHLVVWLVDKFKSVED